jgi:hypothetical protein
MKTLRSWELRPGLEEVADDPVEPRSLVPLHPVAALVEDVQLGPGIKSNSSSARSIGALWSFLPRRISVLGTSLGSSSTIGLSGGAPGTPSHGCLYSRRSRMLSSRPFRPGRVCTYPPLTKRQNSRLNRVAEVPTSVPD